ncbi:MAG: hypothetical protein ACOC4B_00980, partial [Bacteroidota bacterium]
TLYNQIIKAHINRLKDNCYFYIETPYIDRIYRDSYYHYYSSKLSCYLRDCIRISIFEDKINDEDFRENDSINDLKERYLGYFVLRPTPPCIIGRSLISPRALKENDFVICTTKVSTTANSIKFEVEGFPHSSQDTETLSCAETTIWAIMEYFSARYTEYKPVLPSKIVKTLNQVTYERQIPTKGLDINQISFALKEFGFGTRICSRKEYGDEFEALLSCYIESGIPVIVAMKNNNIAHALLCIGHQAIDNNYIDKIPEKQFKEKELKNKCNEDNIKIFDSDIINKNFIFVDDNHPVYQKASLKQPATHHPDKDWHDCKITYFIVPLYPKIYMEAYQAKKFITRFLLIGPQPLKKNSEVLTRFFLTSNRTFKDSIARNKTMDKDLKEVILEKQMAKFIWVAELSNKELYKDKKANGMVIIDATEANQYHNKPLILAAYQDKLIYFDTFTNKLRSSIIEFQNFCIFEQNLKNF